MNFYISAATDTGLVKKTNQDSYCVRTYRTSQGPMVFAILCDGMGTGMGAVQEGRTAVSMLRRLLTAGYPAEHALQSLNSLCALRERAGAVTVDLLELELDTGKASLYKWGAAPSYLVRRSGTEKLGSATPPPGLSVTDDGRKAEKFSLHSVNFVL